MATASTAPVMLQDILDSGDYYNIALDVYDRMSRRIQKVFDWVAKNMGALAESINVSLSKDSTFNVLSVGGGDGELFLLRPPSFLIS